MTAIKTVTWNDFWSEAARVETKRFGHWVPPEAAA
jgi:hypothetical protein